MKKIGEAAKERKIVTEITEWDKKRSKIFLDQEFAFVLYKGEIVRFQLQEGREIAQETYKKIITEILPERAKKRCLNLLQKRPYTEAGLRKKLEEGFYPPEIVDGAVAYVKAFHYIDDHAYACQYIFYHKESESVRKIEEKLLGKGIPKEVLRQAFADSYEELEQQEIELQQAKKLLAKKNYTEESDWKEKQKIYAFLARKGISSSTIRKAMSLLEEE